MALLLSRIEQCTADCSDTPKHLSSPLTTRLGCHSLHQNPNPPGIPPGKPPLCLDLPPPPAAAPNGLPPIPPKENPPPPPPAPPIMLYSISGLMFILAPPCIGKPPPCCANISLGSMRSSPLSYRARFSGSLNVSYASPMSLNLSAALSSSGFLSG